MFSCIRNSRAQASVEAAFMLPVLLLLFLLLLEPCIVLVDKIVLNVAVSESVRLLVTKPDSLNQSALENSIERRLSLLPAEEHVCLLEQGRRAQVSIEGGDTALECSVHAEMKLRPLPLLDAVLHVFRGVNNQGYIVIHSDMRFSTQPQWLASGAGVSPRSWEEVFDSEE